jgi:hypothetical protein
MFCGIAYGLINEAMRGLQHAPIEAHLTFAFKGFVVGSQIPNLILAFF